MAAAALAVLAGGDLVTPAVGGDWRPTTRATAGSLAVAELPQAGDRRRPPDAGPPADSDPAPDRRYSVSLLGGFSSDSTFTSILYRPWDVSFVRTQMASVALSGRLFELADHLDLDLEANVARRFGNESGVWEFNAGLFLRYDDFPWNDRVYTVVGLGVAGPSYATRITDLERRKSGNKKGSKLLNFFSPEIAFSPPDDRRFAFVLRLHHRSGVFGLFDGVNGGSNFLALGARYRF